MLTRHKLQNPDDPHTPSNGMDLSSRHNPTIQTSAIYGGR